MHGSILVVLSRDSYLQGYILFTSQVATQRGIKGMITL